MVFRSLVSSVELKGLIINKPCFFNLTCFSPEIEMFSLLLFEFSFVFLEFSLACVAERKKLRV
ncbi:hypothetical protein D6817_03260 [Candidatus Pacearchaeota archaeon]|nr:MAG: hypothetical protein D6817_03260 [Candidatus Pacearchaeota archaeon]